MDERRIKNILDGLEAEYPEAACSLDYAKDYELLFSARLSAQCTDARVNRVTPVLFERYPSLEAIASADPSELEKIVYTCGFFRSKARDIKAAAAILLNDFGGVVPDTMEELLKLPGVGRKTANLMLGDIYGKPAIVADTHCIRISNRLGFCTTDDPYKVELELKKQIPPERQSDFCHRLVLHGRAVCSSRSPRCASCRISEYCDYARRAASE